MRRVAGAALGLLGMLPGLSGCYESYSLDLCRDVGCPCRSHDDCASLSLACDSYLRPSGGAEGAPAFGRCVAATFVGPTANLNKDLTDVIAAAAISSQVAAVRLATGKFAFKDTSVVIVPVATRLTIYGSPGSQIFNAGFQVKGSLTLDSVQLLGPIPGSNVALDCGGTELILRRVNLRGYDAAVRTATSCQLQMDRTRLNGNQVALSLGGNFYVSNSILSDNKPTVMGPAVDFSMAGSQRGLAFTTIRSNTVPKGTFTPAILGDSIGGMAKTLLLGSLIDDNGSDSAPQTGGRWVFATDVSSYCGDTPQFNLNNMTNVSNCTLSPTLAVMGATDAYALGSTAAPEPFTTISPIKTDQPCPIAKLPNLGDVDPLLFDYYGAPRTGKCYAGAIQPQP